MKRLIWIAALSALVCGVKHATTRKQLENMGENDAALKS